MRKSKDKEIIIIKKRNRSAAIDSPIARPSSQGIATIKVQPFSLTQE